MTGQQNMTGDDPIARPSASMSRWLRVSTATSAVVAMTAGAAVIAGWIFDLPTLKALSPGLATMKINTAMSFVLLGLSIWLVRKPSTGPVARRVSRVVSAGVALLAVGTLGQDLLGFDLHIDELLTPDLAGRASGQPPGRMSPATAICVAFMAFGAALLDARAWHGERVSRVAAIIGGLVGLVALSGYAYGAQSLYTFSPYRSMAMHTAVLFVALGAGLLAARPDTGILGRLLGQSVSALATRRIVALVVPAIFVIAWLAYRGADRGLYGVPMAFALTSVFGGVLAAGAGLRALRSAHLLEQARREADDRVRRSEAHLAVTLESIGDAVIVTDREGRIERVNRAAAELTGWEPGEAKGRPLGEVFRIVAEETREPSENPAERVLREGVVVGLANHTLLITRDGRERAIADSGAPIGEPDGVISGVVLTFRDVTEQRSIEKALQSSERRFRALVQHGADVVSILDAGGTIRYVSPTVERVVGYPPEERVGKSSSELVHPDDASRIRGLLAELAARPGAVLQAQYRARNRAGDWRWMDATGVNLLDDPDVRGLVVNQRDITEQRQIEDQARHAQRLDLTGQLAGGIAHDFNNMLGIIIGACESIDPERSTPAELRRDVREIREAASRAAATTRQLLAFGRRQVLQPQLVDLNVHLRAMSKMLSRLIGETIRVVEDLAPDLGRTRVDPAQMEHVIVNLALNARDAMPDGGVLTMGTRNVELDAGYAREHPDVAPGPYVALFVSDTGTGMDAATQARLFEPFFTTKERGRGTGLGLATVHGIVKQSGGHIWVYSEMGHGTTFKIYLPVVRDPAGASAPEPEQPEIRPRGTELIMVVEDEESLRRIAVRVLSDHGYRVLEAANGDEAVALLQAHPEIVLTVTDVVMPGLSGGALVARLRTINPALRVIYTSGYPDHTIVRHGALEPGVHFLQKPIRSEALLRMVREVLDQPAS